MKNTARLSFVIFTVYLYLRALYLIGAKFILKSRCSGGCFYCGNLFAAIGSTNVARCAHTSIIVVIGHYFYTRSIVISVSRGKERIYRERETLIYTFMTSLSSSEARTLDHVDSNKHCGYNDFLS